MHRVELSAAVESRGIPLITVVVPVRNEGRFLGGTLQQLLEQQFEPGGFEVLVVDGRSEDDTREVVNRHRGSGLGDLRLLDNPARLSSAARNIGVRHARGDLIVVIDGHCELDDRSFLRELADAFRRSGADCLGRPQPLDVSGASPLQQAIAEARASRLGHHPDSFVYADLEGFVPPQSVAVAYRRSVFDKIGLFDESFDACEDVEFNHRVFRAGLRCFFTPRIAVRYHPRETLAGLFRQMVRYGRGRVRLLRKHPDTFSAPGFIPAVFVVGLIVGPVLAWGSPALATAFLGALALYAGLVLVASTEIALRGRRLRLFPWLPLVFVAVHVGSGYGILREIVAAPFRGDAGAGAVPDEAAEGVR